MKTKGYWVVKTNRGGYYCGNARFDPQLRNAQIYVWKEKAEEAIEVFKKRALFPAEITYEIVAISEPKELKDTEAEWIKDYDTGMDVVYVCSNCKASALNDYRGNSVDSRFCPHCGKFMINSTMPEDD